MEQPSFGVSNSFVGLVWFSLFFISYPDTLMSIMVRFGVCILTQRRKKTISEEGRSPSLSSPLFLLSSVCGMSVISLLGTIAMHCSTNPLSLSSAPSFAAWLSRMEHSIAKKEIDMTPNLEDHKILSSFVD